MALQARHKSIDKSLKSSIKWIETIPAVSKVVLGFSESCRHKYKPGHVRLKKDVAGGVKVNGYSGRGVTDIFIKIEPITEREAVKTLLVRKFAS